MFDLCCYHLTAYTPTLVLNLSSLSEFFLLLIISYPRTITIYSTVSFFFMTDSDCLHLKAPAIWLFFIWLFVCVSPSLTCPPLPPSGSLLEGIWTPIESTEE